MKFRFEPSLSLGNAIMILTLIVSASIVWGSTKEQMATERRDLDKLQVTSDHYGELITEIQKTQAATTANETLILEWLKRLPTPPFRSPRQTGDGP
jgi:hypothetical protein